jgi:hypothetical protein
MKYFHYMRMGLYKGLMTIHVQKEKQLIGRQNGNVEGWRHKVTIKENSYGGETKETGAMDSHGVREQSYPPLL